MKKKVYLINKTNITDGLIESDAEVYYTEQERDRAWHILTHDHNEMIRDSYCDEDHRDLADVFSSGDYHYEWDDNHLEFWCKSDPEMHTDYYNKSEDTIEVSNQVYVVLIDNQDSNNGGSVIDMEVFDTFEAAKEHLKIVVEDFKKDVTNWNDTDMYTVEETDESFTWYESGYYDNNHYCVDVYTKTIHNGSIKIGGDANV